MRTVLSGFLIAAVSLVGRQARPQAGGQSATGTAAAASVAAESKPAAASAVPPVADAAKQTEKQKALASQADRLVEMANELKTQVDRTNKNILSLKVVEKAQEIETLAKGMKEQAKKGQ